MWSEPVPLSRYLGAPKEPGKYQIGFFSQNLFHPLLTSNGDNVRGQLINAYQGPIRLETPTDTLHTFVTVENRNHLWCRWEQERKVPTKEFLTVELKVLNAGANSKIISSSILLPWDESVLGSIQTLMKENCLYGVTKPGDVMNVYLDARGEMGIPFETKLREIYYDGMTVFVQLFPELKRLAGC